MGAAIEQIEIKIAYLAQANTELSDVVYRQGQQLESRRVQLSVENPAVLTRPWTLREPFRLRPGERECIESNEDIQRFERLLQEAR